LEKFTLRSIETLGEISAIGGVAILNVWTVYPAADNPSLTPLKASATVFIRSGLMGHPGSTNPVSALMFIVHLRDSFKA
jgi:hypothetical protein